ncbi:hypothetical protein CVE36_04585 [Pseudomonas syringae pv. actinidiae]|nr:hypothetical protein [Pseudomonas syringae pv. actinidiae]
MPVSQSESWRFPSKSDASRNLKERVSLRCCWEQATRFDSFTFHSFANRIVSRFRVLLTGPDALKPDYSIGKEAIPGEQITFMQLLPIALKILRTSKIARNTIRQTYAHVFSTNSSFTGRWWLVP